MTKSMWYKVRWSFRLYVFICKREPYSVTKTVTWFGGVLCTNRIGRMLACTCSIAQLCLTLCDPVDCSLPGSSVPEVFHARILQWVAISFSSGSSPLRDWSHISCIGRRILYHCTTWEALMRLSENQANLQLIFCQVGMDHSFPKYLLDASSVEGNGNPLQHSCLEKSHEQRSLAGHSPWGLQRVGHDWAHSHTHWMLTMGQALFQTHGIHEWTKDPCLSGAQFLAKDSGDRSTYSKGWVTEGRERETASKGLGGGRLSGPHGPVWGLFFNVEQDERPWQSFEQRSDTVWLIFENSPSGCCVGHSL